MSMWIENQSKMGNQKNKKTAPTIWLCELKNISKFKQQNYHQNSQSSEDIYENDMNLDDNQKISKHRNKMEEFY